MINKTKELKKNSVNKKLEMSFFCIEKFYLHTFDDEKKFGKSRELINCKPECSLRNSQLGRVNSQ